MRKRITWSSAQQWRDVGWEAIREAYDGHPERDTKITIDWEASCKGDSEYFAEAEERAIQSEIYTEILTTLKKMIRDDMPLDARCLSKI